MKRFIQYLKDSREELKKVTWPSRKEALRQSMVVIVFSLLVAAFLGLLDYVFNLGLQKILVL